MIRPLAAALLLLPLAGSPAVAQVLTVPPGLGAGDPYHLIFVTSGLKAIDSDTTLPPTNSNFFGGLDQADWVVTFHAWSVQFPATGPWDFVNPIYQAILSTDTVSAASRLEVSGPIYRVDGSLVATSEADLFDGSLDVPLSLDELGNTVPTNLNVWTGTNSSGGSVLGENCGGNFSSNASSQSGWVGSPGSTGSNWTSASSRSCNLTGRLYGISPALTVPVRGDFNGDGLIDAADYTLWRDSEGQTGAGLAADANGDGTVDGDDYTIWTLDYGYEEPSSLGVPEPVGVAMLLGGLACLPTRRSERAPRAGRCSRTPGVAFVSWLTPEPPLAAPPSVTGGRSSR